MFARQQWDQSCSVLARVAALVIIVLVGSRDPAQAQADAEAISTPNAVAVARQTEWLAGELAPPADQPGIVPCGDEHRDVNQLKLTVDPESFGTCVQPGNPVQVTLSQAHLSQPVQGYVAYIKYDRNRLEFQSGQYLAEPYGCPPIPVITPVFGETEGDQEWWYITLEASVCAGDDPTQEDAPLAIMTFSASSPSLEDYTGVVFRDNAAPAILTKFFRYPDGGPLGAGRLNEAAILIDGVPPVLECPPDWSGQCVADVPAGANYMYELILEGGQADDGSSWFRAPTVTFEDTEANPQGSGCPGDPWEMDRMYTLVDCAGNESSCTYHFTVVDDTNPMFEAFPEDITIECPDSTEPSATGSPDGSDNCGVATITYSDASAPGCGNTETITRAWRIEDECGNVLTQDQIITVVDTTIPVFDTFPTDVTVECPDPTDPAATGSPTASDTCGPVTTTFSDVSVSGCGNTETITRTWRLEDECGNVFTQDQIITVVDTTDPVFDTFPTDTTVECPDPTDPVATGEPTASDLCGGVTMTFADESVPGCGNTETITRTWRIEDECGHVVTQDQVISVVDTTDPVFDTNPEDITVECPDPTDPSTTGEPTTSDLCGTVTMSFSDVSVAGCGNTETITRTWRIEDECGHVVTQDQIVTVVDTTMPQFDTFPSDLTVECTDATDPVATGTPTASDLCGGVTMTYTDASEPGCGSTETITRTWRIEDECANVFTQDQIITVVDTTAPVFDTFPTDVTVECPDPTDPGATGEPTASDTCGNVTITHTDATESGCGDTEVITRTWRLEDECGNVSTLDQIITVVDTTDPVFDTFPADITVECPDPTDPVATGSPTASDLCGGVTMTYADESVPGCGNTETITRTWRIEDECGHVVTQDQVITVVDTTNPVIDTFPVDETVECFGESPGMNVGGARGPTDPSATGWPTASDLCGDATVTYTDEVEPGCGYTHTITRTWHVEDECGNFVERVQIIYVVDTQDPLFTTFPEDAVVECTESTLPSATGSAFGGDTCGDVVITYSDEFEPGCGSTGTIRRTWRVTDDCDHFIEQEQIIGVVDTTPPEVESCPSHVTVSDPGVCTASVELDATATDNCSEILVYTYWIEDTPGSGQFSMQISSPYDFPVGVTDVQARATDECDNISEPCDFTVTVSDAEEPAVTCQGDLDVPSDFGVCGASVAFNSTATDNCSVASIVHRIESDPAGHPGFFDTIITSPHDFPLGTTAVQAKATDGAGLTDACVFSVTVYDAENPVAICPADIVIASQPGECAALVPLESTATDNCAVQSLVHRIESDPAGAPGAFDLDITDVYVFEVGTTAVQCTATDMAGLTHACTFEIQVVDEENPIVLGCPEDIEAIVPFGESDVEVLWDEPLAMDNCDVSSWTSTHVPGDRFPPGTTTVTYTAEDSAGNLATCSFDVAVRAQDLVVTVELQPTVISPLTRCITFELWDCARSASVEVAAELTFVDGVAFEELAIPPGEYTCITARDELHTLRQTDEDFHTVGLQYVAEFVGNPASGGDWLIGGNVYEDEWIDMLDFAVFNYELEGPAYGSGDTTCTTPGWHADINGDGRVGATDFTFIHINYGLGDELGCCERPGKLADRSGPVTAISVAELRALGLGHLIASDLNGDGWLDADDLSVYAVGPWSEPVDASSDDAIELPSR